MAETAEKIVTCPMCGARSTVNIPVSVNTVRDPEVRDRIMDETFFLWKCRKCGMNSKMLHTLLYSNVDRKFMVYYIPKVSRSQICDEKLENKFSDLADVRRRVVDSINAMKEKIVIFENSYSDMAVELSKLAVAEVVSKITGQTVYEGYCTEINKTQNQITFQFFLGANHRSYIHTTRYDVYNRSLSIVKECFQDVEKKRGFLNINQNWASEALRRYKGYE